MKRIIVISSILLSVLGLSCGIEIGLAYESKGKRDPFVSLIGGVKSAVTGLENIASIDDLRLEGIAMGPSGNNMAILNGEMVKENDVYGLLEIKKITKNSITVSIEGVKYTLNLIEPGGEKSGK